MLKSKLIDVLKTFSPAEIKSFRNFLLSPIHNTNRKVIKLFELIKKYYPDFNSKNIQKELLFKKLYPSKKYSDIVMRILLSDMLRLTEEFLAYNGFINDRLTENSFLLKELHHRKLDSLFNRHIKESEHLLNEKVLMNNSYFLNRFYIESAKYDYLVSTDKQDKAGIVIEKQGEYLVDFFLMNGLNIMQEMQEFAEVLNYKFENNLTGMMFKYFDVDNFFIELKKCGYKYHPLLEIYYYLYSFSKNYINEEYFVLLKNSIINNLDKFDESESNNLLLALESCAITRIRMGLKNGREDLMEVYELMITRLSFSGIQKDYMQANLFRNIFYNALLLKRTDWAENFVSNYIEYLLPEQRPDMIKYTGAMLFFENNEYEEALKLISKINYTFFVFKYEAKILMIKLYYELNSFEPALSQIDTFSHFLSKNKKVSATYKETFMHFLKFAKMLLKLKTKSGQVNKVAAHELLKKAESMEHFMSKKWIIEKIQQIL